MKFKVNETVVLCRHIRARRKINTPNFRITGITKNGRYNLESIMEPMVLLCNVKSKHLRMDGANEIVTIEDLINP